MNDTTEVLKKVRKIEITTRRLVEGLIAGNYHSIFKGQGIEFSEIREYKPGDDIRAIDWKVTARYNQPFVKEFIEERDLNVYFAFDMSGSGEFGDAISKRRKAIEMVASLMFAALRNNDNIGLFLFSTEIEKFIPARKGRKHVLKMIRELVTFHPKHAKTNINASLSQVSKILKKRSTLFIVSDFCDEHFLQPLKIMHARHDIIALKVSDHREHTIPDVGMIHLEDEETGEQILVDTSDEHFRKNYAQLIEKHNTKLLKQFRRWNIDAIPLRTEQPYEIPLRTFFKKRRHRTVY